MGILIKKFSEDHLEKAVNLFLKSYAWEREVNPLLPTLPLAEPELIMEGLKSLIKKGPGVALFQDGRMIAYMQTGDTFNFKGQKAAFIPEYAHGAEIDLEISWECLYKQMYKDLSSRWIKEGIHLHLIGFLAHDQELKEILFQLGFGAVIAERIRDLREIMTIGGSVPTERIGDPESLVEIHGEHHAFYPEAPIFIKKSVERDKLLRELQGYNDEGDALFIYRDDHGIGAYMAVGESTRDGEGFLLQNSNTAQIKTAFVRPECRRRGVGTALLNRGIEWAREEGFDALFVEHETANPRASSFWGKYFDPYVYFAMRYIDDTL
ncbi:MAG: GNAT family N-acetyltransferase [Spirochaetales bacterium]|nr:GNAT family N-acetyltransferase [Spirochaetales bacterium]